MIASQRPERVDRAALIEASARALIDSETNGLCGSSWPAPCDMCDCGLEGMSRAVAGEGVSAQRDRERVAHVLDAILPLIADAIEARREFWGFPGELAIADAARLVRSFGSEQ